MTVRFGSAAGLLGALLATFVASTVLAGCGGQSAAADTLRFTAIPDSDKTELAAKFAPLVEHLSAELGVPVEFVPSTDYGASVEMFKNGDVHLAWFGGLTGVKARLAVDGARAIAQGGSDPNFKSYFIAHESTGLERGDDFPTALAELSFVFGSRESTSGRLMPEHFLREATGQSPEAFFGDPPNYSGSHDKTVQMVARGEAQAGAVNYKVYDRMVADGEVDPAVCRIIWETPPYADYNWTVRPEVDGAFGELSIDRLQAVLLALDDPALLDALLRPEGLIPATNADFASIEDTARAVGLVR